MGNLAFAIVPVTPLEQNCTLLWDKVSMKGVIVDPGGDIEKIATTMNKIGVVPEAIWITHGHIDHAGGAMQLKDNLNVEVVGPHFDDKELCESLDVQAQMFGVAGSVQNLIPDRWLEEGEVLTVGNLSFDVLHCPGHAPGHVVFINRPEQFAHVGDVLFRKSIGRTDLLGGSHETLIHSIKKKLLPIGDDTHFVCGHGVGSTFGRERRENPFLK